MLTNIYMKKELFMFDSTIAEVFKELKINSLLSKANIQKRCGIPVNKVVYDLFHVPFLMLATVFLFVRNQFEEAVSKNVFYRFLENANYNWHLFTLNLSWQIDKSIASKIELTTKKFFVLDDTITEVSGKLIESASYILRPYNREERFGVSKACTWYLYIRPFYTGGPKNMCWQKKAQQKIKSKEIYKNTQVR